MWKSSPQEKASIQHTPTTTTSVPAGYVNQAPATTGSSTGPQEPREPDLHALHKFQPTHLASVTTDKQQLSPQSLWPTYRAHGHNTEVMTTHKAVRTQLSPKWTDLMGNLSQAPLSQPLPLLLHEQGESMCNSLNIPHTHTSELLFWSPLTTVSCPAYPPSTHLVIPSKALPAEPAVSCVILLQLSLFEDRDSDSLAW